MNVYIQILNLPPYLLSRTDTIFLVGTINCLNLGSNSIERAIRPVLKNVIEANNQLREIGYKIEIAYFAGDTPICQAMCGFVEAVGNANWCCRKCYINKNDILKITDPCNLRMRSVADYEENIKKKDFGVLNIPNYLSLNLLDPVTQTPMDIMHCIPEGCCRKQVMRIFEAWIISKRCSWVEIKACLDTFPYGYAHAGNKITNFKEYDLKKPDFITSSSQMVTLVLLFPFIFQNILDMEHEEYR